MVLIHCFACEDTGATLAAVGLSFADLYERPLGEFKPARKPYRADDVLDLATREALTLSILASDFARNKSLSSLEIERIFRAASRLGRLHEMVTRG